MDLWTNQQQTKIKPSVFFLSQLFQHLQKVKLHTGLDYCAWLGVKINRLCAWEMIQRQLTQNSWLSIIRTNILHLNCFKVERKTAFFGEDIFFVVPSGNVSEVVFKPRTNNSAEVVLLQEGKVVNPRCHISSLGHLVLEDVQEEDEGLYIVRNISSPNTAKHIALAVKGELSVALQVGKVFSSSRLLLLDWSALVLIFAMETTAN